MRALFTGLLFLLLGSASHAACPEAPQPTLPQSELVIESRSGLHPFTVELAETEAEKACGLMRRQRLGSDEGMLFDYRPGGPAYMWMANTVIPLDIFFIAPDGRIVHIEPRTTPLSHTPVGTSSTIAGVLELPAGTAEKMGIDIGDRVAHGLFTDVEGTVRHPRTR